jgi:RNA polymerase sigma-70 factor (ECF subfamily)
MTDEAIMSAVKSGNLDLASELYDRYSKRLYNYFVKISLNREVSNDLMQNTFLRIIKYRHTYKDGNPFKAWMFQIGRNVFADYLRKEKMKISDFHDVDNLKDYLSDSNENEANFEKVVLLHKSMSKLNDEAREILVLSRYQNMKYEEISQLMNISVPAVKVKVHRAIKKLRDYYFEFEKI